MLTNENVKVFLLLPHMHARDIFIYCCLRDGQMALLVRKARYFNKNFLLHTYIDMRQIGYVACLGLYVTQNVAVLPYGYIAKIVGLPLVF